MQNGLALEAITRSTVSANEFKEKKISINIVLCKLIIKRDFSTDHSLCGSQLQINWIMMLKIHIWVKTISQLMIGYFMRAKYEMFISASSIFSFIYVIIINLIWIENIWNPLIEAQIMLVSVVGRANFESDFWWKLWWGDVKVVEKFHENNGKKMRKLKQFVVKRSDNCYNILSKDAKIETNFYEKMQKLKQLK